jgi:hypothetical protein
VRVVQRIQRVIQDRIAAPGLAAGREFRAPWWLKVMSVVPGLRDVPARLLAFGPRRVRFGRRAIAAGTGRGGHSTVGGRRSRGCQAAGSGYFGRGRMREDKRINPQVGWKTWLVGTASQDTAAGRGRQQKNELTPFACK